MALDGERTDPEVARDVGGGAPFGERAQDLLLSLGQHGETLRAGWVRMGAPESIDQPRQIDRGKHELACRGTPEHVDERSISLRRQDPAGTGGQRQRHGVGPYQPGARQDPDMLIGIADRAHDLGSASIRTIEIDEGEIGESTADRRERFLRAGHGTEDCDRTASR